MPLHRVLGVRKERELYDELSHQLWVVSKGVGTTMVMAVAQQVI